MKDDVIDKLQNFGMKNPYRVKKLIEEIIASYRLNLDNLVVLTEAASKNYVVTPIIAALAGAKVFAITYDSKYGSFKQVKDYTNCFAEFCGVEENISVINDKNKKIVNQANIITNLGFVRPIDKSLIEMMNKRAVIPLMYESWEFRGSDLDIKSCEENGILVMATNEEASELNLFDYCGPLCLKMLFKLDLEVNKNNILIVSSDKFGIKLKTFLIAHGAEVKLINSFKNYTNQKELSEYDVIIIADYLSKGVIIGDDTAQINSNHISKNTSIIQFAGDVDINRLKKAKIPFYPRKRLGNNRMGMTFADLGPKPLIELNGAGLKVGELMARARLRGITIDESKILVLKHPFAQEITRSQNY
jgi:hypothetical protein